MAGNWKLNPASLSEARTLLKLLSANSMGGAGAGDNHNHNHNHSPEAAIFPPFPYLSEAIAALEGSGIKVGAQNIGLQTKGAYTGEVAASMVRSLGCDYVLVGHSERRSLFEETDDIINQKVHLCLEQAGLSVVLCVGETLEEREADLLSSVVDLQVKKGLLGVQAAAVREQRVVIAYEPVWAIGTGRVATPQEAQQAHVVVRRSLADMFGRDVARQVRIQYGGSVTPESIDELMRMPDVDGALVGGASLAADSFSRIIDGAANAALLYQNQPPPPRELTARECVACKNVLGESPVWSVRDQALYWISAPEEEVWTWNLRDAPYRRLFGTMLGCVVLLNRGGTTGTTDEQQQQQQQHGSIVLGGENAFLSATMSATTSDFAAGASLLCDRPEQTQATRPNDGRVDRQGRFVFGMYNNYHRLGASAGENNAGLYRMGPDLEIEEILDYKYRVSNCICFPSDGDTMYFCDTPTRKVYAFDYPTETTATGPLTNRRLVYTMPASLPGGPDGAQVDADGYLWIALSGAGRVVRVDPTTGAVDTVVHLPVKSPTSVTFGGLELNELFITTRGPDGGGLYRVTMPFGIKGLPEPEFIVNDDGGGDVLA